MAIFQVVGVEAVMTAVTVQIDEKIKHMGMTIGLDAIRLPPTADLSCTLQPELCSVVGVDPTTSSC